MLEVPELVFDVVAGVGAAEDDGAGESGPAACTQLLPARLPVDLLRRASRRDAARRPGDDGPAHQPRPTREQARDAAPLSFPFLAFFLSPFAPSA